LTKKGVRNLVSIITTWPKLMIINPKSIIINYSKNHSWQSIHEALWLSKWWWDSQWAVHSKWWWDCIEACWLKCQEIDFRFVKMIWLISSFSSQWKNISHISDGLTKGIGFRSGLNQSIMKHVKLPTSSTRLKPVSFCWYNETE
jgi:hypothetical protein